MQKISFAAMPRVNFVSRNVQYLPPDGIKPWSHYAKENTLHNTITEEEDEKAFEVDEEINSKVSLWQGDISTLEVDRVVADAANSSVTVRGETRSSLLRYVYNSNLELMLEKNLRTIACPCISTDTYGYPVEDSTHVALLAVRKFMEKHKSEVDRVIFTTYSDVERNVYEDYMQRYFPIK